MNRTLVFATLGALALMGIGGWVIGGDHRERKGHEHAEHRGWFADSRMLAQDPLYRAECGSCHLAYPPGLLPAASWQRIMIGLEGHFGDDASLDPATAAQVGRFLEANAADANGWGRSRRIARSLDGQEPPLRITDTAYFRRQHQEIPPKLVLTNPEVGSYSRCEACHQAAAQGNFDEHGVRIPGVGSWHD